MATQLYISPVGLLVQQLTNLGAPLAGGLLNIYQAGTVNTPQATYTDSTGTTLNATPIVLNSAGRLAASNAPVSIWVPSNTPHKMVLTDAAGNLLSGGPCMDNLYGINDPIGFLGALATATTGSGADLVANAMRSYDVVASVRAANVPNLASGQTLVIDVEGGALVNDGNGGLFYWSPISTATDDGLNVIKPAAILSGNPGRYLRQVNLFGTTGSFVLTATGLTTSPTMTVQYVQNGNQITLTFKGVSGVSNSTSFGFTGFPNALQGVNNGTSSPLLAAGDNTVSSVSCIWAITSQSGGSAVVLNINNSTSNWTASGTKSLLAGSFSYVAT